jgi:hypothetical protein
VIDPGREAPEVWDEIQQRWISCHLYYHQNPLPVIRNFVHPLVVSLLTNGHIDAFFFVRYGLGGPHIRLRLRVTTGSRERALEATQQSAQRFLALEPSSRSLAVEEIRRINESILAANPNETDDTVYPDNSFRVAPFRPEIERYGGLNCFRASLDFFTLSSVAAVELLVKHGDAPRSVQLTHAFRLLLQQALGFAVNEVELLDLLRYGVDSWGKFLPKIMEKGHKVVHSQIDDLLEILHQSLSAVRESPRSHEASDLLVGGSRKLSTTIKAAGRATRAGIGGSQLHMTANRLGLANGEEVYLSRLMTGTLEEARLRRASCLCWLEENTTEPPPVPLGGLLPSAFSVLVGLLRWRAAPSA